MPEDAVAASVEIPKTTISLVFLGEIEGGNEVPLALVFDEKLADEIGWFLADRFPQPEDTLVGVRLLAVHPDLIEKWVRS